MSTKNYFMFTLFLLSSLSNVNAMDSDTQDFTNGSSRPYPGSPAHLSQNYYPSNFQDFYINTPGQTPSQSPFKTPSKSDQEWGHQDFDEEPNHQKPTPNHDGFDFEQEGELSLQTPMKSVPQIDEKLSKESKIRKAASLNDLLAPLTESLQSARLRVEVECDRCDYISEYMNQDQKVIYSYFPKTKVAEDYMITASGYKENLFKLYVTALKNEKKTSDLFFWRIDRADEKQSAKPGTTNSLKISTMASIVETLRENDVALFATTGFMPALARELSIPVVETEAPLRPTRIFRVNTNFQPSVQSSQLESQYEERSVNQPKELLELDFLK